MASNALHLRSAFRCSRSARLYPCHLCDCTGCRRASAHSSAWHLFRRYIREEEQLIARLSSSHPPVGPLHRLEHDLDVSVLKKTHSLDALLNEDARLGARVAKLLPS
jgi:hypothetical protein